MSQVTTKTVEINAHVALEESTYLIETLRNRNLVNAQARFDLAQINQALGQQLVDLQKKLETILLQAEADAALASDERIEVVDPESPEA